MKLFIDLTTRRFVKSAASSAALPTLVLKRRDIMPVEVVFVQRGAAVATPAGTTIRVALKSKFSDANFLALADSGTLDLYTTAVEDLFPGSTASADALLEVRWTKTGEATRTATLGIEIQNSVILGTEGTPSAVPDGKATQAEAEAGTSNEKWMTPLRTAQAIAALGAGGGGGGGGGVTSYNDLTDLPTLGTAAATASTDYATAAQGAKADSALQSDALTPYRTSAAQDTIDAGKASSTHDHDNRYYTESEMDTLLAGKQPTGSYATAAQGAKADTALQSSALTPYRTASAQDTLDAAKVSSTDPRLTDSRQPTSHKSSHATGGTDALSPADIGAEPAISSLPISKGGTGATTADQARINLGITGGSGGGVSSYNDLTDLPTLGTAAATASSDYATAAQGAKADSALQSDALTPYRTSAAQDTIDAGKASTSHKSSHATGGADALTPADIGAATAAQGATADAALQPGTAISNISGLQAALDEKQPTGSYATIAANNNFTSGQTITAPANTTALTATYSVTGANTAPIFNLTGTWNTTGIARGILLNITDTASASGSSLLDVQTGGASRFRVEKDGRIVFGYASIAPTSGWAGNLRIAGGTLTIGNSGNGVSFASQSFLTDDGVTNSISLRNAANAQTFRLYGSYTNASNGRRLDITSTTGGIFTLTATGVGTGATGNLLKLTQPILLPASSVTLATNGDLAFEATSNTQLTIRYRGTDGTTRSATLALT
jgi:hypothetical protein